MRRLLVLSAVLALLVAGSVTAAAAQTATAPAATGAAATCTKERYDIRSLLKRLAATPKAEQATPAAAPTAPDLTGAKPADEATVTQVTNLMREFIACANTGDPLKEFSFYTDDFLVMRVGAIFAGHLDPSTADQYADQIEKQQATPEVVGQETVLDHVEQVQVLPDGRIVATVFGKKADAKDHGTPVQFFFVKSGDQLMIDGFFVPEGQGTPGA